MSPNAKAISFIRQHLKYKATKRYVGGLSGNELNKLWRTINETEINGMQHRLHCGHIDVNILQKAFLREMSYNPIRFWFTDANNYSPKTAEILNLVNGVITRFAKLWPNGINGDICIVDTSDVQYNIMRDIRDCFRAIANQNMADLKVAAYRDEIVAHFADDATINMGPAMRLTLQDMAAKTMQQRAKRREIADIHDRMVVLEKQMGLHIVHDREVYLELLAEHDALKAKLDILHGIKQPPRKKHGKAKPKQAVVATSPIVANPLPANLAYDDTDYESDAAEREAELLRSMTSEHCIDETFQEYVEKMTGLKLTKSFGGNQH